MNGVRPTAAVRGVSAVAVVYSPTHCVVCGEPLDAEDRGNEAVCPVLMPHFVVHLRVRFCTTCLSTAATDDLKRPSALAAAVTGRLAARAGSLALVDSPSRSTSVQTATSIG
jgi:hypothetical protein